MGNEKSAITWPVSACTNVFILVLSFTRFDSLSTAPLLSHAQLQDEVSELVQRSLDPFLCVEPRRDVAPNVA